MVFHFLDAPLNVIFRPGFGASGNNAPLRPPQICGGSMSWRWPTRRTSPTSSERMNAPYADVINTPPAWPPLAVFPDAYDAACLEAGIEPLDVDELAVLAAAILCAAPGVQ